MEYKLLSLTYGEFSSCPNRCLADVVYTAWMATYDECSVRGELKSSDDFLLDVPFYFLFQFLFYYVIVILFFP